MTIDQPRQPAGAPTGGRFSATARPEATTTLPAPANFRSVNSMKRTDQLAATSTDEATQLRIARLGDTAQREMLQQNPNLTVATLGWIVDHWTFNPRAIPDFAAHPNMTDELRARIRPW